MPSREERVAALVWTRLAGAPPTKPALSIPQIVTAATHIADAEGIDAVSMRKVAARLGSGTMSLYRHVATRDELIDLMVDAALGEEPLPAGTTGDWRSDLAAMARRARRLHHRHPWLVTFSLARPAFGPNALDARERYLRLLDGLELPAERMLDLVETVSMFVNGFVEAELADTEAQRRTGLDEQQWRAQTTPLIQRLLASGRYPTLSRLADEAEDSPDLDSVFERRLGYLLDGLAVMISSTKDQREDGPAT